MLWVVVIAFAVAVFTMGLVFFARMFGLQGTRALFSLAFWRRVESAGLTLWECGRGLAATGKRHADAALARLRTEAGL
jgi:hypothetical protein